MRLLMMSVGLLALAACGPTIPESGPNSGAGVGFGDYSEYQARQAARDAQLAGGNSPAAASQTQSDTDVLAAQTRAALDVDRDPAELAANSGQPIVQAGPGNPAPMIAESPGISVENSFEAVSARRSIEDDAERTAELREQYHIASVQALPGRPGDVGPNIVAYALASKHAPGTQVYRRGGLNTQAKHERACAAFSGPDMAQIAFLEKGGPERDRLGLDPDGDGFACGWDPRPFRKAAGY
jgi:hypothetical protein